MEEILGGIWAGIKALIFAAVLAGVSILIARFIVSHNSNGAETFDPVAFYHQVGQLPVAVVTVLVFLFGSMTRMYMIRLR